MLEAHHYTAAAKKKGSYALPAEFEAPVNEGALYHAVRAYRNNQRQGTHATKTRSEVSGGNRKPWRQKGTGRARQGTTRAPHWVGGGVAFGPTPRKYTTRLPRKVRQVARRSAFTARAQDGAIHVLEQLEFAQPKTKQLVDLLTKLGVQGQKVLILTAELSSNVYLSGRNVPGVRVLRYQDAAAYDILWADALVVEEAAIGGHALAATAKKPTARAKRATKVARTPAPKAKQGAKPKAKPAATRRATTGASAAKPKKKKKGGPDA
ncbi:MAG: 50S ribosomal protein L4 [Gemmatimonadota bacterium]|nr:50S ribosomal protein L4 [Gemmatimonadota bacterium]